MTAEHFVDIIKREKANRLYSRLLRIKCAIRNKRTTTRDAVMMEHYKTKLREVLS